jgi:hypothetical protein
MGLFARLLPGKELKPEQKQQKQQKQQQQQQRVEEKRATFRPAKEHKSKKRLALSVRNQCTLGSGNLAEAIMVPPGEDLNEWLVSLGLVG